MSIWTAERSWFCGSTTNSPEADKSECKTKGSARNAAFLIFGPVALLNEHFVLRDGNALPPAAFSTQQKFQSRGHTLKHCGESPNRRDHGVMHHGRCFLHAVQGAVDEFVGADDLQPGAVDDVIDGGVEARDLSTHHRARFADIGDGSFDHGPQL